MKNNLLEFGSADHLQNSGILLQTSTSNKNFFQRKKFNNSAYFRVDSPNRFNLSPETTDNNVSPFRRINKPLKNNCLSSSNYFDTTLKSEDSGSFSEKPMIDTYFLYFP